MLMLSYNEILEIVYETLKSHKRWNERIHWSVENDIECIKRIEKIIVENNKMEPTTEEQWKEFYKLIDPRSKGISRNGFEIRNPSKHKKGWVIDEEVVDNIGLSLSASKAFFYKGSKIIYYVKNLTIYMLLLLKAIHLHKARRRKVNEVGIIQFSVLKTIWHERRHVVQKYLQRYDPELTLTSDYGTTTTRRENGYDQFKKCIENDANYWSTNYVKSNYPSRKIYYRPKALPASDPKLYGGPLCLLSNK